jgi:hypothetical protein
MQRATPAACRPCQTIALMTRLFFSIAAALCLCPPAWAQYRQIQGTYASPALQVRVILLDDDRGVVAASAEVVSGSCSGSIAGIGEIRGRILTVTPYQKTEGGGSCRLELEFDRTWKQVKGTGYECQVFSGAACGFEGQSARKRNER